MGPINAYLEYHWLTVLIIDYVILRGNSGAWRHTHTGEKRTFLCGQNAVKNPGLRYCPLPQFVQGWTLTRLQTHTLICCRWCSVADLTPAPTASAFQACMLPSRSLFSTQQFILSSLVEQIFVRPVLLKEPGHCCVVVFGLGDGPLVLLSGQQCQVSLLSASQCRALHFAYRELFRNEPLRLGIMWDIWASAYSCMGQGQSQHIPPRLLYPPKTSDHVLQPTWISCLCSQSFLFAFQKLTPGVIYWLNALFTDLFLHIFL